MDSSEVFVLIFIIILYIGFFYEKYSLENTMSCPNLVETQHLHTNEDTKRQAVEMLVQVKNSDSLVTNW